MRRLVASTAPVSLDGAPGKERLWTHCAPVMIPLSAGEVRVQGCQRIANAGLLACTDWASNATCPAPDQCLPLMYMPTLPICAQPPGFAVRAASHPVRCQVTVATGMPLSDKRRVALC